MVIAALVASALPAAAAPAVSPSAVASAEIAACLQGERWRPDARHLAASAQDAPGLPAHMEIARVPTADGRLYVYHDDNRSRVIECGVAIYGPATGVDPASVRRCVASSDARLRPASPDLWRMASRPDVQRSYWGSGVYGVMLLQAPSGPGGPTLQVDRHSVLIP